MNERKLNRRQQEFLDLYLAGEMPTDAYQKAYQCSRKVALRSAYRLLDNVGIKEAIEDAQKRIRQRREKKLEHLVDVSIDNIEKGMELDVDDPSLNFIKIMAMQLKARLSENHLKRMGLDAPDKIEHSGSIDIGWKEIIYGTAEKKDDSETEDN